LEGSTFWKFLTTLTTRSVTSDLSRKVPLTSSEKRRRMELKERPTRPLLFGFRVVGMACTFTLRYFSKAPLAAILLLFYSVHDYKFLLQFSLTHTLASLIKYANISIGCFLTVSYMSEDNCFFRDYLFLFYSLLFFFL